MTGTKITACGILRRLASIAYDLMLLISVLFLVTVVLILSTSPETVQASKILYPACLLLCSYLYFVWHWIHGGQTLGMKAWRIAVVNPKTGLLNWKTASLRFLIAFVSILFFGFGLLWAMFNSEKMTFYDYLTGTRLVISTPPYP